MIEIVSYQLRGYGSPAPEFYFLNLDEEGCISEAYLDYKFGPNISSYTFLV